ncbi:DUF3307 domain-containing protein [Gaetbulibacter aestuarii]|uniref:DUF3307 domain-containing protein n=1 Tax=Gaetbulibacter aestuarii TaxID=1502358 RepID=A0ABW7N263_9FLAO
MMSLFIKIFLAHIIGDFIFQPEHWVNHKQEHKLRSKYLYAHMVVHLLALVIILQFNTNYWLGILIILCSHYIIDGIKLYLNSKFNPRWLFALDQLAHIAVIAFVVQMYTDITWNIQALFAPEILLTITGLLCVTKVSSIIMKILISKWDLSAFTNEASLKNAGAYIGMLERLFVFAFIITNHWEGVGFLIAAKSVFRFGDLSKAKDRKLTEYILIGTLLSFGLAIAFGLIYLYVIEML